MLTQRRNLVKVEAEPGDYDYRRLRNRAVRLKGVLDIIGHKRSRSMYYQVGRIAIPKVAGDAPEFNLLTTKTTGDTHMLLIADDEGMEGLRAGFHPKDIRNTRKAICHTVGRDVVTLDATGNLHHQKLSFPARTLINYQLDCSLSPYGNVDLVSLSRAGIWIATDWLRASFKLSSESRVFDASQ